MNTKSKTALIVSAIVVLIISSAGCTFSPSAQPSGSPSAQEASNSQTSPTAGGWGGRASPVEGASTGQTSRLATAITITGYPSTVRLGQQFTDTGRITAGNSGVPYAELHCFYLDSDGQWKQGQDAQGKPCTFYADSAGYWTFFDVGGPPGPLSMKFVYHGDSKYLPCESQVFQVTTI